MEFFSCDPFILKKNLQIMMYVLPFFWRLFRRNDQAIPRITKMTKSTVRDVSDPEVSCGADVS